MNRNGIKSLKGRVWYKEFLENTDQLEIECPIEEGLSVLGEADKELFNLELKTKRNFEIGRAIYNNENKRR